jgi:hypothetical protein
MICSNRSALTRKSSQKYATEDVVFDLLDDTLATHCLPLVRQFIPAEPRGEHVPFGPVVPVAEDASPYDQLVAWQGRKP